MKFCAIQKCHRSVGEQRYIWAAMQIWNKLPMTRREAVRTLIGNIARTPEEGRSLFDVMVRGYTPESVSYRIGVPIKRVYELRSEFYDRFVI